MPKNIKNIITAKFRRSFVEGLQHTWLFCEAPLEVKTHIAHELGDNADVIICTYFTPNHWFAATEDVLTIKTDNGRQSVDFKSITKVDCDLKRLAAHRNQPFEVIDLYTTNGIVPLEVEKRTWGAWVEVLKLLLNKI
ncbi:MAG: hypothetical protein QM786_00400 [Breznakibacter sp.]